MKKKPRVEARYYNIAPESTGLHIPEARMTGHRSGVNDSYHFHNCIELGYCYSGSDNLHVGTGKYPFHGGTFTIIPKNFVHKTVPGPGRNHDWEYIFIDLDHFLEKVPGERNFAIEQAVRRIEEHAMVQNGGEHLRLGVMIRYIMEVVREKQEWYMEELRCLLAAFFLEITRILPGEKEVGEEEKIRALFPLNPALQYIGEHFDSDIRVEQLAQLCHISETHFRRCFHETLQMTPVEYMNRIRIRRACEELQTTGKSIHIIAEECGFSSISTFNRNFSRQMNCSPREWRRNIKK